jgi:signal transduction histidine kinase
VMIALGGGAAAAIDRSPDQARRALDELVDTGRGALGDVRRILGVLHAPDDDTHAADGPGRAGAPAHPAASATGDDASSGDVPMAPQPGVEDLDRLVDRFRTAGLPVRTAGLAVAGLEGLDATVQLAVFRIGQESLTNTLRHAPGTASVDVAVRHMDDAIEVVVTDSGPGDEDRSTTAPVPGSGRGIAGMTGRVAAFGGTLEAGPHLGGWRVRAVLPQPGGATGATASVERAVPATNEGEA